jgi:hypothetical protein
MREFLLRFWRDPAYFTALCRGLIGSLAGGIQSGLIVLPVGPKYAWFAAFFIPWIGMMFPAGQTNAGNQLPRP